MAQENLTFYTLNATCTNFPIKQKVYIFSQDDSSFHKTSRNPERPTRRSKVKDNIEPPANMHNIWKPTIPSKKLFEDPRFFLSLQRKKFRIINGIKNMSILSEKEPVENVLRGKKLREGSFSLRKVSSSMQPTEIEKDGGRRGWEPSNRTPYLNFNMQYLIKRRKSMTPTLYHPLSSIHTHQFH